MPERPILLFSEKIRAERTKKGGGSGKINFPGRTRQINRLAPKFLALQNALNNGNLIIQNTPNNIETEYTLVFEIAGNVDSFYSAINCLNDGTQKKFTHGGYAEIILDLPDSIEADDDFYNLKETGERADKTSVSSKLYCVSTNGRALQELLSLWNSYSSNENFIFPFGKTGLRAVFEQLSDIRQWGIQERLEETGILDDWFGMLPYIGTQSVKCEIELFYSKNTIKQQQREDAVASLLDAEHGRIISRCLINEINYHGLLVELPRNCIEKILNHQDVDLIKAEQIMFFRSTGQQFGDNGESIEGYFTPTDTRTLIDDPVIALLDGLPQENHPYLQNYLTIDDPDDYSQNYLVSSRRHGTAMASLIVHGDLNHNTYTTTRKIYVRPIMKVVSDFSGNLIEEVPNDILLVDKVHAAVRRMFENTTVEATAPHIKVINFSIGDSNRIFSNVISPLARLLDWLSYKYNILFIVSAGNHYYDFDLGETFENFASKNTENRTTSILKFANEQSHLHKLLSPAESMNALTIGAMFSDFANFNETQQQILPCENGIVDPASAIGKGINKSIKPDIMYYGGRNTFTKIQNQPNFAEWRYPHSYSPGILSAAPFMVGNSKESYSSGTSNATALISHEAARCYDIIDSLVNNGYLIDQQYYALLIKAMLVHGAEWDDHLFQRYSALLSVNQEPSDTVYKYFGYGLPDVEKAQICTSKKAILIGFGELKDGEADIFSLPLPFDFSHSKIHRKLTITLASFAPTIANRQKYKASQVFVTLEGKKSTWKRKDADWQAVMRGTLQHEIFENDKTEVWGENDKLGIKINCRNDADPNFVLPTRYAVMVSFEIKDAIDVDVYTKIAEKIRPRITTNP